MEMSYNKKVWTEQQDRVLQTLIDKYSMPYPWKQIAKEMKLNYGIIGKNFKDCRERWQNYIPPALNYVKWSENEELLLLQKQQMMGNKWFQLCLFFPGRKQTFLKNQFYSIFRKALKKANAQIYAIYNNKVRPITRALILKALVVCENRFSKKVDYPETLQRIAEELKRNLIYYLYSTPVGEQEKYKVQKFLQTVNDFRKHLKKKGLDQNQGVSNDLGEQQEHPIRENFRVKHQQQILLKNQQKEITPIQSYQHFNEKQFDQPSKSTSNPIQIPYIQQTVLKIQDRNPHIQTKLINKTPQQPQQPSCLQHPFPQIFNSYSNPYYWRQPSPIIRYPPFEVNPTIQSYMLNYRVNDSNYMFNPYPHLDWNRILPRYY